MGCVLVAARETRHGVRHAGDEAGFHDTRLAASLAIFTCAGVGEIIVMVFWVFLDGGNLILSCISPFILSCSVF